MSLAVDDEVVVLTERYSGHRGHIVAPALDPYDWWVSLHDGPVQFRELELKKVEEK